MRYIRVCQSQSQCVTRERRALAEQRDEHECWVQSVRAAPVVPSMCKPEVIQQAKATATLEQRRFRENSDVLSQLKQLAYLV